MKNSIKNKFIIIIFMLVFLLLLFTNKVSAAEELYYGTDIKYEITDYYAGDYKYKDVACITWVNKNVTSIEIPSTINGYTVAVIGDRACSESAYLQTITLPNTLEAIENMAFYKCTALKNITIPDSVYYVGQSVFVGCTSLTDIKISKNIKKLNSDFMSECTAIQKIEVPNGVESLEYDCFYGCTSLKNVSLPNTLKKINKDAFHNCTSLETFTMPDSVTDLGGTGISSTFSGCTNLKSIKLSKGLTYIPSQMFQDCPNLEEIIVPDNVKSIGSHIFTDSGIKRLSVPQQLNSIGWGFINDATSIKEFIFPAELRNPQIWQFGSFEGLTMVFPRTIETMEIKVDTMTNCTAWGFSETPVKDWATERGITFKELPLLKYSTHVQNIGDQDYVTNGVMAGTSGKGYRLENIKINLDLSKTGYTGGISYSTHIENIGWQDAVTNGQVSGTSGKGYRLEAIKINLTGNVANYFNIYYRVHAQNVGWLDWAKNGEAAGTEGYGFRLEGIEILILPKTLTYAPGNTTTPYMIKEIVKVAKLSDTSISLYNEGETKQLTANFSYDGNKLNDIVWTSSNTSVATVSSNGTITALKSGTAIITATSPSTGLSAKCNVKVNIITGDYLKGDVNNDGNVDSGDVAQVYVLVKYNNATDRELQIADMNGDGVLTTEDADLITEVYKYGSPSVLYTTHVQNVGWQDYVKNGQMAGTSGRALRLEGIKIKLNSVIEGGIEYSTHIENIGWETTKRSNDEVSGTSGRSLRLEAIKINLTGNMAKIYDVYYRVHAENVGWLGWAKNGEPSGTAGYGFRLEGIEIKLVEKGNKAPGSTTNAYVEK